MQDRSAREPGADRALRRVAELSRIAWIVTVDERRRSDIWNAATAWMALVIPAGYGERIRSAARRRRCRSSPTAATPTRRTSRSATRPTLIAGYAQELAAGAAGGRAAATRVGVEPRVRVWFNPQLESRDFMIPGILALLLLVVTTNLSSMAIVREKELGTLEQLNVTPLAPLGADRRQAAALRAASADRRAPGARSSRSVLVRGAAARQLRCCCLR